MSKPVKINSVARITITPKPRAKNIMCNTNDCVDYDEMFEVVIKVPGWAAWVEFLCKKCVEQKLTRRKNA